MSDSTYGIDFGTSNSAVAFYHNGQTMLLDLPGSSDGIVRSVIFFCEEENAPPYIGKQAIEAYIANGMKGRLIQSVKSVLPDFSFHRTIINGRPYGPDDLVAVILRNLKAAADDIVGADVKRVVLGRPALFSSDTNEDHLAQERLHSAAIKAGFEDIRFQFEPIAASLSYEKMALQAQTILVADLGAGTSDFALLRIDPNRQSVTDRRKDILATTGIHYAGDDFDAALMWNKVIPYLGYGATYGSWGKRLKIPEHVFRNLCAWEKIAYLKTDKQLLDFLYQCHNTTNKPTQINNLLAIIEYNLGFHLFQSIETAKIALSDNEQTTIDFHNDYMQIHTPVKHQEFNEMIRSVIEHIIASATFCIEQAGIGAAHIDNVYLTGGSSLIPSVHNAFETLVGRNKCRFQNTFSSVAEGLALSTKYC